MRKICQSLFAVFCGALFCVTPARAGKGDHFGPRTDVAKYVSKRSSAGTIPVLTIDSDDGANADASVHLSNKGAVNRGLQGANGVADEHGETGRTNTSHRGHH